MRAVLDRIVQIGVGVVVRRLATALVLSAAGTATLMQDEGSVNQVYLDPVAIPTVCVGHVTTERVGTKKTDAQCAELLKADTGKAQAAVRSMVKVPVSQDQYDVLVSFVFNVGPGNFQSSTLLLKLNSYDCFGAAAEFPRWNKARGRVLPGLVVRRAGDQARFVKDCS